MAVHTGSVTAMVLTCRVLFKVGLLSFLLGGEPRVLCMRGKHYQAILPAQ